MTSITIVISEKRENVFSEISILPGRTTGATASEMELAHQILKHLKELLGPATREDLPGHN